jgi:Zn-dependent peptidase ImmA (M78 family)
MNNIKDIISEADKTVKRAGTKDPRQIAESLGIIIMPEHFNTLKGAYKVVYRQKFIFLNDNLDDKMSDIVILHEIGHDRLHRKNEGKAKVFQEFSLFSFEKNDMEHEANLFAAEIALDDNEFLEYVNYGYDVKQIASAMNTNINLAALKSDILISKGVDLNRQEHKSDFLKYE